MDILEFLSLAVIAGGLAGWLLRTHGTRLWFVDVACGIVGAGLTKFLVIDALHMNTYNTYGTIAVATILATAFAALYTYGIVARRQVA